MRGIFAAGGLHNAFFGVDQREYLDETKTGVGMCVLYTVPETAMPLESL